MNAVITGASRGIGRATAEIMATHGYDLYLCSQNEYRLLQTIEELKNDFPQITIEGQAFNMREKKQASLDRRMLKLPLHEFER